MKYLCLVYLDRENWAACPDPLCGAYAQDLAERGKLVAGEPLHPVESAATVKVRNGSVSVTDGPFAETKEMLAGFFLVEAKDLNEAIRIASDIPSAKYGSIEVRPVRTLDLGGGLPPGA